MATSWILALILNRLTLSQSNSHNSQNINSYISEYLLIPRACRFLIVSFGDDAGFVAGLSQHYTAEYMWKISMFEPYTHDMWKCAVWLSLWESRCTACFPLVMFLHEDLALLQLSRSKSHNMNRASDPECFSRSVIWINVLHTVITSNKIYTSVCNIKLHITRSLREDISFTQKWNEIYLFSLSPYVVMRTLI